MRRFCSLAKCPVSRDPEKPDGPCRDSLASHATCHSVLKVHYSEGGCIHHSLGNPALTPTILCPKRHDGSRSADETIRPRRSPEDPPCAHRFHSMFFSTVCTRKLAGFARHVLPPARPGVRRFANIGVMLRRRGRERGRLDWPRTQRAVYGGEGEGSDLIVSLVPHLPDCR